MNPQLIYDVGMNNGDDTAYYLSRGFRVLAIEPNPQLVATAAARFRHEIQAGDLTILNIGVAAEDGELPFWVCETDSRLSSFDLRDIAINSSYTAREIRVQTRAFRSILDDFGTPFYLKIDIQGNDRLCVEALTPSQLPRFLSIEFRLSDTRLLALMHARGFKQFKCISQSHFLPLELPLIPQARMVQRAQRLNQSMNPLARIVRKLGGRRWIAHHVDRLRVQNDWVFPPGSSGPFGDETLGRWLSYDEIRTTTQHFLRVRAQAPHTLLWAPRGLGTNPFWTDLHARADV